MGHPAQWNSNYGDWSPYANSGLQGWTALSGSSTPPAPGQDLNYDAQVAYDQAWFVARQPQPAPTPEQYIQAIANAAPTICGGGVFAYGGRSIDAGPASGFAGGIIEADTQSGVSKGALFEAGGGEGYTGGGGMIVSNGSGGLGSSNLVYGGVGGGVPGAHVGAGLVGFSSGVGAYGELSAGGREVGAGAYLNITTNAGCFAR